MYSSKVSLPKFYFIHVFVSHSFTHSLSHSSAHNVQSQSSMNKTVFYIKMINLYLKKRIKGIMNFYQVYFSIEMVVTTDVEQSNSSSRFFSILGLC